MRRRHRTLLLVCAVAAIGGDRERGMALFEQGRFAEAAAAFQAALAAEPDSVELQWNLALASFRAGDLATAESAVEAFGARAPSAPERHLGLLGAIRMQQSDLSRLRAEQALAAPPAAAAADGDEPEEPLPLLERALQQAAQAQRYFVRAVRKLRDEGREPVAELQRNTERAGRRIEELRRRIEELQQQQQQQDAQQPGEQDEAQQEPSSGDEPSQPQPQPSPEAQSGEQESPQQSNEDPDQTPPDERRTPESESTPDQQQQSQQQQSQQPGEGAPDEQPPPEQQREGEPGAGDATSKPPAGGREGEPTPEPQPLPAEQAPPEQAPPDGDGERKPAPGEPTGADGETPEPAPPPAPEPAGDDSRSPAPGEVVPGRELTPEQTQRLLERLRRLDQNRERAQQRVRSGRRPVERDW